MYGLFQSLLYLQTLSVQVSEFPFQVLSLLFPVNYVVPVLRPDY